MGRMTGDRCVIILVTAKPWRWRRYLNAWTRTNVEWVVCSEVSGLGGLLTIAEDYVGFRDLLAIVTDLEGRELIAAGDYTDPDLPKCPFIEISPQVLIGDYEAHWKRYSAMQRSWVDQNWPNVNTLIMPSPAELVAWCVGWWVGKQSNTESINE